MTNTEEPRTRPRAVVLGLDGATFTILRPWMEAGRLPNLARLAREGVHGQLESVVPPYSAPAWVSLATGKGPGKHGIVDFWRYDPSTGERRPVDASDVGAAAVWDILGEHGRLVGVVNVPLTYPPRSVNGVMVSGMMTPGEDVSYTYPPELKNWLKGVAGDYAADPYTSVDRTPAFLKRVLYWVERREAAHLRLLERHPFDFFINVVQALDPIQHHFWRVLDESHPNHDDDEARRLRPLLLRCYQAVDEVVGYRLRMLDGRTTLFVVSDHGFGPVYRRFNVNRFLLEHRFLALEGNATSHTLRSQFIEGIRTAGRMLDVLNLRGRLLDNRQRETLRRRLDQSAAPAVDWSRTGAYYTGLTGQGLYVNLAGREKTGVVPPGGPYEELRDSLIAALVNLRDPDTGAPVVSAAYRREEIYVGPRVAQLPDVVFSLRDRPYLPSERMAAQAIIEPLPPESAGGRHHPSGVFLAAGPDIHQGAVLDGACLIDIAPTILYALGLPVPEDMDGRVLTEVFTQEHLAANPVRQGAPSMAPPAVEKHTDEEADAIIAERLRALGYLD
ncbi:MAG: alkaline phosphatase family protein [Anaerolineales bacterium]|nr:alkaline phosphatase family protein [Anaerolineales bacterium]